MSKMAIAFIFLALGTPFLSTATQFKSFGTPALEKENSKERSLQLEAFGKYLRKFFSKDTCIKPEGWEKKNPTFGQCAVSTLAVKLFFGGEILEAEIPEEYWDMTIFSTHLWNKIDGHNVDFTKEQFPPQFPYDNLINGRLGEIKTINCWDIMTDEGLMRNFITLLKKIQKNPFQPMVVEMAH